VYIQVNIVIPYSKISRRGTKEGEQVTHWHVPNTWEPNITYVTE